MQTSVADTLDAPESTSSSGVEVPDAAIAPAGHIGFRIPTRLELIGHAAEYICRQAKSLNICDEDRANKLNVALHEALTNAMVHGNLGIPSKLKEQPDNAFGQTLASRSADPRLADRQVRVELEFTQSGCEIAITDDGAGFDIAQVSPADGSADPEENADEILLSGRGILMMRAFTDGVRFAQGGRQAILTLVTHTHKERRADPRFGSGEKVRVFAVDNEADDTSFTAAEGTGLEACVANVSKEGAALVLASRLRSARRVLIEATDGGQPLAAEICRVVPVGDGIIQIGCRFLAAENAFATSADESAMTFLPSAISSVLETLARRDHIADERRSDNRYLYSARVSVHVIGSARTTEAFSRDLSRRGLALIASTAFPLGRPVTLTLTGPSGEALPPVTAKIVRCQRITNGVFDIGCEFSDASAE